MSIQYKEISFNEFAELGYAILFHEERTSRCFGIITNELISFKFSWQSDSIDPILKICENNNSCTLGIDQMFSIIKFSKNAIKFVLKLDYLLYDIKFIEERIWIITELEIVVIDGVNFNFVKKISLPSFFQAIILNYPVVKVECIDGEILYIDLPL